MTDPVSRWLNDEDQTPVEKWTSNRLYRKALEMDITDPRRIANAAAVVELAERLSTKYPTIPFDHLCEGILMGLDQGLPTRPGNWWKRMRGRLTAWRISRSVPIK